MGLLRIPLVATIIGVVWLWMGFTAILALAEPAWPTTCGSPDLATHDHILLSQCEIGDHLFEGSAHWVVLHAPGSASPSVLAEVHGEADDAVVPLVADRLARGDLELVRNRRDADSAMFASFPYVASATFVGEWRAAATDHFTTNILAYLGLGAFFVLIDVFRLARWFYRRVLGRAG